MKTKGIYTHTRCRRKHRLFCKFESCKGNKISNLKIKQYEKVIQNDNYTPEAYTQNSKFIDDAQKEIYSLLEGIKRDVECI